MSEFTGCGYCIAAHVMLGKMVGLSADTIRQIRTDQQTGDAKRDALIRFVRVINESSGTISDEEFAAVRSAGFTETQVADIALAVALTVFTNTFNRANNTELDFPPAN